jgi:acylphosphatase
MTAKKLLISGLVQGVGFRFWACQRAEVLGLSGWVRNRRDGSVEALVYGETSAVEEFVRACRLGPRNCRVKSIIEELVEPPVEPGFHYKPTF